MYFNTSPYRNYVLFLPLSRLDPGKAYLAEPDREYRGIILEATPAYAIQKAGINTVVIHFLREFSAQLRKLIEKGMNLIIRSGKNPMVRELEVPFQTKAVIEPEQTHEKNITPSASPEFFYTEPERHRDETLLKLNTEAQKIAQPERSESKKKEVKVENVDTVERKIVDGIERAKARFAERQARETEGKRREEAEIDRQRKERQAAEKRAREEELKQKREEERQKRIDRDRRGGWSR